MLEIFDLFDAVVLATEILYFVTYRIYAATINFSTQFGAATIRERRLFRSVRYRLKNSVKK